MAITYIDIRDDTETRADISETRYRFNESDDYWVIAENGDIIFAIDDRPRYIACTSENYSEFFTLMTVLEQEIVIRKLKEDSHRDDIPF